MKKKRKKFSKKSENVSKRTIGSFIKKNSTAITIVISFLAIVSPSIFEYFGKANDTEFKFYYLTVKVDDSDYLENLKEKDYAGIYHNYLNAPTIHNEINDLFYHYKDKVVSYYVTYLIVKEIGDVTARDVKLNFRKYGKKESLEDKEISDVSINKALKEEVALSTGYSLSKDEIIKVPISICTMKDKQYFNVDKCYYMEVKPISIEYRNKYLFSKRKIYIREYLEHNVIVDGEVATGMGGTSLDE